MPETRLGRHLVFTVFLLLGLVATGVLGSTSGSILPQRYAHTFYVVKGLVAVVAVALSLFHMSRTWSSIVSAGQRLRYLALLMLTVLIASSSTAQLSEGAPVSGRNVGALLAAVLVLVAMAVSVRQDRRP